MAKYNTNIGVVFFFKTRNLSKKNLILALHPTPLFKMAMIISRYAVVALFVEVNSIFLHIRQLLNLTGVSKKEPKYRMNSMLNIGTFVVFRIAVLGWMTRWIVLHKDDLSLPVYTLGSVGMWCYCFMFDLRSPAGLSITLTKCRFCKLSLMPII